MADLIDVDDSPANPILKPSKKESSSEEEMTPKERAEEKARHECFLKAREEGMRRAQEDMRNAGREPARFYNEPGRFRMGFTPAMLAARGSGPRAFSGPGSLPGRGGMQSVGIGPRGVGQAKLGLSGKRLAGRVLSHASNSRVSNEQEGSSSSAKKAIVLYAPKNALEEEEVKEQRKAVLSRIQNWLEDANEEVKEVIMPVIKLPIVELLLLDVYHEAERTRQDTRSLVIRQHTKMLLLTLCRWIEKSGVIAATELHDGYKRHLEEVNRRRNDGEDVSPDELRVQDWLDKKIMEERFQQEGMLMVMEKCEGMKQLGMCSYESDNLGGALMNWKKADEDLRRYKHLYEYAYYSDKMQELHAAVLKNRALGCLRLDRWNDALDCASCAIEINDADHKAWFRKACALEAMGRINEAGECLFRVQQLATDRPDRARIMKEVEAKKESLSRVLTWIEPPAVNDDETSGTKSLPGLTSPPLVRIPSPAKASMKPEVAGRTIHTFDFYERRRITKEEARRLLQDLRTAYDDIEFQREVLKLSRDVHRDKVKFLSRLKPLALPLQRPVLEAWEFEPSERGVQEMSLALGDWTRGARADPDLMEEAANTAAALYGAMFEVVFAPGTGPPPARHLKAQSASDSESDDGPPALVDG